MRRQIVLAAWVAGLAVVASSEAPRAHGVNPLPLPSAYWRLEEGPAGQPVATLPNGAKDDTVLDSINTNHMEAYNTVNAPLYQNSNLPPTYLRGVKVHDRLAWMVNGIQDVYSSASSKVQNGIIGGKYDHDNDNTIDDDANPFTPDVPNPNPTPTVPSPVTGFTLEAAFNFADTATYRSIVAKEGRPGLEQGFGDSVFQALPTLSLNLRGAGDPDEGKLQIQLFDQGGSLKTVTTAAPLSPNQWYYASVVNDGTTLSLYLDHNDGQGYQLEGTIPVAGALFQGLDRDNADWSYNWTIGRATFGGVNQDNSPNKGGAPADWFKGLIDEVRLTNSALTPAQFLFTQDLIGDFNKNGQFEGGDFLTWQRGFGPTYDAEHLADWKPRFGVNPVAVAAGQSVPEPAALCLAAVGAGLALRVRRRSR